MDLWLCVKDETAATAPDKYSLSIVLWWYIAVLARGCAVIV